MKRLLIVMLLLMLPSLGWGQETKDLSKRPDSKEIASAESTLKRVQSSTTAIPFGGYALINIKIPGELTTYTVPGSDDCLKTIVIPKGKPHEGFLVSTSDMEWQWRTIEPSQEYDRLLVAGKANGTSTVLWMTVVDGKPVVVDGFKFEVGKQKPKPVDPVTPTNALAIAALADIKAGRGTVDDVAAYAGLFLMYGTEVKNGTRFVTTAELNKEMNTKIDQLLGEDHKTLDSLRTAVGKELVARIPSITASSTKVADIKTALSTELLNIYKQLSEVK